MGLDQVRVVDLIRVARVFEHRSFSAAARSLGERTKAVSRGVARVEEELGERLFHRSTRRVVPTGEGAALYEALREALDALDAASVRLGPASVAGHLRIQVLSLFADAAVAWAGQALEEHADLDIELIVRDTVPDLVGQGVDIALVAEAPQEPGIVLRRLGEVAPALGAHRSYVARRGLPARPEDLAAHDGLRFGMDAPASTWALRGPDGRVHDVAVGGRLTCNDSRTLQHALALGRGIGPVPPDLDGTDLVAVLPGYRLGPIRLFLAIAPGRRHLARVRLAADGLAACVAPLLSPAGQS